MIWRVQGGRSVLSSGLILEAFNCLSRSHSNAKLCHSTEMRTLVGRNLLGQAEKRQKGLPDKEGGTKTDMSQGQG
jgi:hypothetical protein